MTKKTAEEYVTDWSSEEAVIEIVKQVQQDSKEYWIERCADECLKLVPPNTYGAIEPIALKCCDLILALK